MKTIKQIKDEIRYIENKQMTFDEIIKKGAEINMEEVVVYAQNSAKIRILKWILE